MSEPTNKLVILITKGIDSEVSSVAFTIATRLSLPKRQATPAVPSPQSCASPKGWERIEADSAAL